MFGRTKVRIGLPTLMFFAFLILFDRSLRGFMPFVAAILHELGHIAAMALCGQRVESITVLPFGIDIKKKGCLSSYKEDVFVASAGIATNLLLILICSFLPKNDTLTYFKYANLLLITINVLPVKTLDGGQIMRSWLLLWLEPDKAEGVLNVFSFIFILLLSSVAVWLLFSTSYNFSLLLMCMYLFFGIFLKG